MSEFARVVLLVLVLVATAAIASPSAATTAPDNGTAVTALAPTAGSSPASAEIAHTAARGISIATITRCISTIRQLGGCALTAFSAVCLGTYSKLLGCIKRVYSGYRAYEKVVRFQQSDECPFILDDLRQYICRPQAPTAPRFVMGTVLNGDQPLRAYTGPSSHYYRFVGTYPTGARVGVVCATRYGEVWERGSVRDAVWARLTNGYFLPRVSLWWPGTVPWC